MRGALTKRQQEIYGFIVEMIREQGYPPTLWEIAHRFRLASPTGVVDHLKALERKGYIRRVLGRSRGIEVADYIEKLVTKSGREVPIVGRVVAGKPLLALENIEGTLLVDKAFVKGGRLFALRVRGESMVEAGIFDGDLIIARQQKMAENGEIVVALLGDEATVKRFFREKERIRLQPANRTMEPIFVKGGEVQIQGKVVAVFRPKVG